MQQVQTKLLPFDAYCTKTKEVPEGLSLSQIAKLLVPAPLLVDKQSFITVNGEVIPQQHWHQVKPKLNAVVAINTVPAGGGGGKKNPLATIISIATIVAAPYLASTFATSAALGIFGGGVATAGQVAFASGLIRVAVGLAGFLVSSALSSPPSQSNNVNNTARVQDSPTQYIEGSRNSILQWGVVPIVLGRNRMFPPQAALPYTETQNNDQFVRQLFTFGFGKVVISDEKIGETALEDFSDYSRDVKLNADLDDGVAYYTNDVFQEDASVTLSQASSWSTITTQNGVDEFEVDITFINGLVRFDSQVRNKRHSRSVTFEIRYALTGTTDWTTDTVTVTDSRPVSIRRSFNYVLPSRDQYDVQVRRTTADSADDAIRDVATWTALRSFTYTDPVRQQYLSGAGFRFKATDELNGTVDRYNAIVSAVIPDYDVNTDTWVERETSNPASIFRYVLQSDAFAKKLPDSRINLTELEAWHVYCDSLGLEYNRIIDYEANIETVLSDIAAAGFASKYNVEGIYSVIVDNTRDVVKGVVTPKNSWGYKGGISYPEIPHGLIVEFRNKDKGYALDERIIYDTGYNEDNATLYERIEFASCTNSDLAYIYGRRFLANIKLQPEIHSFYQDPEFLTLKRGDRFTYINDAILVGVGSARIKSLTYDDDVTPTEITGFVLDDEVTIPSVSTFGVRIRYSDASGNIYHGLTTTVGSTDTFEFETAVTLTDYVAETDDYLQERQMLDALCSFVEFGNELDLIVLDVRSDKNHNAKLRAINYAPSRFSIDNQPIPDFDSNVTLPLTLYRPEAPQLVGSVQSDESVIIRNPDGTYVSRMVINLFNRNEGDIDVSVRTRRTGDTQWFKPEILSSSPEEVILTGLEDGVNYDIEVRYKRLGGANLLSVPLQLNNTKYIGASTRPESVSNFRISVIDETNAVLQWAANPDIDISHYEIRYKNEYSGVVWETATVLDDKVLETRMPIPFRGGTYLIKAVDIAGNESLNETTIITYDPGNIRNVVETLEDHSGFTGTKDNVTLDGTSLILTDIASDGYYYMSDNIDVGNVATSYVDVVVQANGRALTAVSGNDVYDWADIFTIDDMFGIGAGAWLVQAEYRVTSNDPSGSPTWTAWSTFIPGFYNFRAIEVRLLMRSLDSNITPEVTELTLEVDMPDRIERGEDLTVDSVTGATVAYSPNFQANPSVNITIQDGAADDKIEFSSKNSSGFTFKVYNETVGDYVSRTFDYVTSGYGRV